MKINDRSRRHLARAALALSLGMAACVALMSQAAAQPAAYPAKPVRMVVPFPPGGPADSLGRILSQKLSQRWGQQLIVDNKPGGATVIGAVDVARASPDGYTLLLAIDSTLTMNSALFSKLPYDPVQDFTPVSLLVTQPLVLVANDKAPAGGVRELIAAAKASPGKINFGSGTITTQLAGEMFNRAAGVKLVHVPYKGGQEVARAVLAGEVQTSFDGIAANLQHIRAGKLRALATTGLQRAAALPEIPTLNELGLTGYEARVWLGLMAPKGTPKPIIDRLNADVRVVLAMPDVIAQLAPLGLEPIASSPEAFAERIKADAARFGPLIKELGIKLD